MGSRGDRLRSFLVNGGVERAGRIEDRFSERFATLSARRSLVSWALLVVMVVAGVINLALGPFEDTTAAASIVVPRWELSLFMAAGGLLMFVFVRRGVVDDVVSAGLEEQRQPIDDDPME